MDELPPLVVRARQRARAVGFPLTRQDARPGEGSACLQDVGRFLAVLAAGCVGPGALIGELGTGTGVGTAWLANAMPPGCALISVERDERRAAVARALFAADPRVQVLTGDSMLLLAERAPYDLIFDDGGGDHDRVVELLKVGGRIVVDDVTPQAALPADSPFLVDDPKRRAFFGDPRLIATEVVLPDLVNSLIVGTRTAPRLSREPGQPA